MLRAPLPHKPYLVTERKSHVRSRNNDILLALILGKRMGFEIHVVRPHNVPAVMLGCGLLFVGWFGFNGGSALAADGMPLSLSATPFLLDAPLRLAGSLLNAS